MEFQLEFGIFFYSFKIENFASFGIWNLEFVF